MALNTSKCNHLTPLPFKGLMLASCHAWLYTAALQAAVYNISIIITIISINLLSS